VPRLAHVARVVPRWVKDSAKDDAQVQRARVVKARDERREGLADGGGIAKTATESTDNTNAVAMKRT